MENKKVKQMICSVLNRDGDEYEYSSLIFNVKPYKAKPRSYKLRCLGFSQKLSEACREVNARLHYEKTSCKTKY